MFRNNLEKWAETEMTMFTDGIVLEKANLTGKVLKDLTVLSDWVAK